VPKFKILSGEEVIKIFQIFGFAKVGQKGSYVKLRRIIKGDIKQTLTIPNHPELDKGTLKAIYSQAIRYIPENELSKYFY